MDFNSFDFSVEQKPIGVWLLARIALICFYVLFVIVYFLAIFITRMIPLGAFIPLFVWILVFLTWKYATPEYKYTINRGVLTFFVVYGKKHKKRVAFKLTDAKSIVPVSKIKQNGKELTKLKRYNALPKNDAQDAYLISFTDENGKAGEIALVLPQAAIKIIRFYNAPLISSLNDKI